MSLINDDRCVADIINETLIENPQIKQIDVAEAAGYLKPNNVYMIKTGKTKVPLSKAGRIAEALGLDPSDFWFKCLREYSPEIYEEFERINKGVVLTTAEIKFIKAARIKKLNLNDILKEQTKSTGSDE